MFEQKEAQLTKEKITEKIFTDLNNIMEKWMSNYSGNCSGGKMRCDRGCDIEQFIIQSINYIGNETSINIVAKKGSMDKKELKIKVGECSLLLNHSVISHVRIRDVEQTKTEYI